MTGNKQTETMQKMHQLFSAGKLTEVLELVTSDVQVVVPALGATFTGRDGFMQFMRGFKDAFPDIQIAHQRAIASGDDVAIEFVWSGTHTGPLATPQGAIPPTGKSVSGARVCELVRFKDGKVASLTNYQDVGTWMRQLGLVK
jgi:steroid delta-isomerase-like uncharacterized protein